MIVFSSVLLLSVYRIQLHLGAVALSVQYAVRYDATGQLSRRKLQASTNGSSATRRHSRNAQAGLHALQLYSRAYVFCMLSMQYGEELQL